MAQIIDGKKLAEKVRDQIQQEVKKLKKKKIVPGLAVILVGEDPASQVYVRNKILACEKVGMKSFHYPLPAKTSQKKLLELIQKLNKNKKIHGILVQLPLPKHLKSEEIIRAIAPQKDVDGLHPYSLGRLASGQPTYVSCTPAGMIKMLEEIQYDCSGKEAVVIGRSNIVGKPIALLLLGLNATVTVCHSKTLNLPDRVRSADIVVAAVGIPKLVKKDWVKPGAIILDVGINRMPDGKLVGDVDFEEVSKVAGAITPVPGGVGPMTITMLLWNTLIAARTKHV
ncbi:MAG: bifunctional methylenetetrahydrofolate dehydrogenase/methenyltetrahydrofolate cyclohydrolase FolD [Deltaproteobacteria bacterium]|nr:bifunctional methylenetetrahydrofolate dehydrogenase/methenyltetrahydrofolate cyclohydrolase FolD [Deltaproteobacteria bacterium]